MKLLHNQPAAQDDNATHANASEAKQAARVHLADTAPELFAALEHFFSVMHDVENSQDTIERAFDKAYAEFLSATPDRAVL